MYRLILIVFILNDFIECFFLELKCHPLFAINFISQPLLKFIDPVIDLMFIVGTSIRTSFIMHPDLEPILQCLFFDHFNSLHFILLKHLYLLFSLPFLLYLLFSLPLLLYLLFNLPHLFI